LSHFAVSFYLQHAEASAIPYIRSQVGSSAYGSGEALVSLGRLRAPGAGELLIEALDDRQQSWSAARGLGELAKGTADG
jgi:hypothetical protein